MGILDMTDELDAFVTRHTDQDNRRPFVPIIMENVTFMADMQNNVYVEFLAIVFTLSGRGVVYKRQSVRSHLRS